MINRLLIAAVIAAVSWLVCVFVGGLLAITGIPIAVYIGDFLVQWAVVISILTAVWVFFRGPVTLP